MAHKSNPHTPPTWSMKSSTHAEIPDEPCKWEKFLLSENIEEKNLGSDPKVLEFIMRNFQKFYVPTAVLKMYEMDLEE